MMMDLYNQEELIHSPMKKKEAKARAEGSADGKQNTLLNLVREGVITLALAANKLGLTEQEVERML